MRPAAVPPWSLMQGLIRFLRANPQAAVLLFICVVLGLGTFVAVVIALAGSGNATPSGEPADVIAAYLTMLR